MDINHRNEKLMEPLGSAAFEGAFRIKVRRRRWAVALVTFGISLLGFWLMLDVVGVGGWTPLKIAEMGLFALLFTSLSFGFTQAFLGFLVLAEGHEPLKITNTLDNRRASGRHGGGDAGLQRGYADRFWEHSGGARFAPGARRAGARMTSLS